MIKHVVGMVLGSRSRTIGVVVIFYSKEVRDGVKLGPEVLWGQLPATLGGHEVGNYSSSAHRFGATFVLSKKFERREKIIWRERDEKREESNIEKGSLFGALYL